MAEEGASGIDNIAANKSSSAQLKDEDDVIEPNLPEEESFKGINTHFMFDPSVGTNFYPSRFLLEFLEKKKEEETIVSALLALQNPVSSIPSRSLLPTTNPQAESQTLPPAPSNDFVFAVPQGRPPRSRNRRSSAFRSQSLLPPRRLQPRRLQPDNPLLSVVMQLFEEQENPSETPSLLLPLLLDKEDYSESSSCKSTSPLITPDAPSFPSASVNQSTNVSPSKRPESPSANFQVEPCDSKKHKHLIPDEATSNTSGFEELSKPDSLPSEMYPFLLKLSEMFQVPVEAVLKGIDLDLQGSHEEKTCLFLPIQSRHAELDAEEKTGFHESEEQKVAENVVEENSPRKLKQEKLAGNTVEEKTDHDKAEQDKPTENIVEEKNELDKLKHEKLTKTRADYGGERKGGPYKNKPAS